VEDPLAPGERQPGRWRAFLPDHQVRRDLISADIAVDLIAIVTSSSAGRVFAVASTESWSGIG
jgi:hypothetical protein